MISERHYPRKPGGVIGSGGKDGVFLFRLKETFQRYSKVYHFVVFD